MAKTGVGGPTNPAEERLNELLRDAPNEEDLRDMLPSEEELTSAIDRLLSEGFTGS